MPKEQFEESGDLTNGEAKTLVAIIAGVDPTSVRTWIVIAHVHQTDGEYIHETRSITNAPLEAIPQLITEGLETL